MGDELLTVNEAAGFLSVHPWQVRKYIKDGALRAYMMGGSTAMCNTNRRRWRIWRTDLVAFVNRAGNKGE